jgi:hypothetical protein
VFFLSPAFSGSSLVFHGLSNVQTLSIIFKSSQLTTIYYEKKPYSKTLLPCEGSSFALTFIKPQMKLVHMLGATGLTLWPLVLIHLCFQIPLATAQGVGEPGGTCSDSIPCYQGCCSKEYSCGFTPDHCGDGCKSSCNATAECGQYAPPENFDCPINVCCR